MSVRVMKPAIPGAGLVALALFLVGGGAAAAPPQPVALKFITAVDGLAKNEIMIVRLREDSSVESTVDISFFDAEAQRRVGHTSGPIGPGKTITASLDHDALLTEGEFPGAYATVLLRPGDPDDLAATQLSLHVEFFNTESLRNRDGGTCSAAAEPPSHGGGGRDYTCTGGITVFPVFAISRQ